MACPPGRRPVREAAPHAVFSGLGADGLLRATSPTISPTSTSTTTTTTLVFGCFTDTGDGTIHDTCTGLQWEKKTTAVGSGVNSADLDDVDNFYTWAGCCNGDCATIANFCQPNAAAAATCAAHADGGTQGCGTCANGTCNVDPLGAGAITTVWDWLNGVNAANFAGHSDWRLPSENGQNTSPSSNPRELETILLSAFPCVTRSPCIDPIFGPTVAFYYWSATTNAPNPIFAWSVYFGNGGVFNSSSKYFGFYVRAVRSGL